MISDKNIQIRIIDNLDTLSEYLSKENVSTLFDLRIKPDIKTKNFFSIFFDFDFDFMIISGLLTREISLKYILFYKFKNFLIKLFFLIHNIKIKHSKYVFVLGDKCDSKFNFLINSKSILIRGHHADYDRFLERKENTTQTKKSYFVFLDQNAPFHQDLMEMRRNDIDADNYYFSIKNFLEITKKKHNAPLSARIKKPKSKLYACKVH